MPTAPYTRILLDGVPFWKDNADGKIYYYTNNTHPTPENRIFLGSEAEGLVADWQSRLDTVLTQYQSAQKPRAREQAPKKV